MFPGHLVMVYVLPPLRDAVKWMLERKGIRVRNQGMILTELEMQAIHEITLLSGQEFERMLVLLSDGD